MRWDVGERHLIDVARARRVRFLGGSLSDRSKWLEWLTLTFLCALALGVVSVEAFHPLGRIRWPLTHPNDYSTYIDATRDWLSSGVFYEPYQLAGPYVVERAEIMYPPPILALLVPFAVLPAVLWYIIPLAITVGVVIYWQPSGWACAGIAACLAVPETSELYANGNPGIWMAAAVALATRWPVAGSFVLLKPTLALFALVGVRRRAWWVGAGGLLFLSVASLPMWADYVAVLSNARGVRVGPLYSAGSIPSMLIPLIAWFGSNRRGRLRPRDFTGGTG